MKKKQTKAQQRVAIMRDVLKQIAIRRLIPRAGTYVHVSNPYATLSQATVDNQRCLVCAKGALFLSSIRIYNQYNGDYLVSGYHCVDHLSRTIGCFSSVMLTTIENVFEGWDRLRNTRWRSLRDKTRLIFICRHIIRNKGSLTGLQRAAMKYGLRAREQ